ncbi:uncharacterized protein LOC132744127 isoform X2 [Ruditapes philippinarum]|uniref:uncharacterized protein LOC132744127 isoform X2 n=1 Tax=Ruditapes philippinarum TaxID=129788 RepID=UPI00295ADF5A|nr:uncharacterized protein LOC132744127 isoform X2 [Ruditapes philippinarum]
MNLKYFCLVSLFVKVACQSCIAPKGSRCIPIGRPPASCITKIENGTSLTWFHMQENCVKNKGRLIWLRDDFNTSNLAATETTLTGGNFSKTDFLVIGLLHSMKGDDLNFWRNPHDNDTLSCGTEDTALCLQSPATEKQCNIIGCCWLHGKCQYPERQWLSEKTGSDVIDTTAISGGSDRSCVGLQKSGKDWSFKAFSCSSPPASNTGYVCEYKCQPDWSNNGLKNVTWPRSGSTGVSSTAAYSDTTGHVITTTDRNKAAKDFNNQVMSTICGLTVMLMCYMKLPFM